METQIKQIFKEKMERLFKEKKEQQRIFVIFELLCLIPALLLTIIFLGDVPKKGIVIIIVISLIVMSQILSWKRKKEIGNIIQFLKKELRFWKAQKLEYQKVMEEITKKAGKEVDLTWVSNKIVLTEKNIQEIESWIENFKKLGWVYLDLAFF